MVVWGRSRNIVILLPLSMGFKRVICQMKGALTSGQKENSFENLTCGCHGNMFVGVT